MDRWAGRVAIVTGASSGIGAAIAKLLAQEGMKVVGVARRLDKIKALAAEVKGDLHALQCDVTKEEDINRVVQWTRKNLGGADVLVNSAGVMFPVSLTDLNTQKLKSMIDTNVTGLCMLTSSVLKDMKDRGVNDGHIFHINSVHGQSIVDKRGAAVYGGTKHAVRVLTEGLRRELRGTNIRVTSISPGRVRSEMAQIGFGFSPEAAAAHYDKLPCLEPRDLANALLYALSSPPHVEVNEITIAPVGQN